MNYKHYIGTRDNSKLKHLLLKSKSDNDNKIIENPNERWEQGIEHHPKSKELARFIGDLDYEYGDYFCFKFGGDGDNGEQLMYLMDVYFENKDNE